MFLTPLQLSALLRQLDRAHPYWSAEARSDRARALAEELSPQLRPVMVKWLDSGLEGEYDAGEFSVRRLMGLCGVGYLDALELMDTYLKDPEAGRTAIFFRGE